MIHRKMAACTTCCTILQHPDDPDLAVLRCNNRRTECRQMPVVPMLVHRFRLDQLCICFIIARQDTTI